MPPGDVAARGNNCLDFITDLVIQYKRKYSNPYVVVGGDFNQWKIDEALADFVDLSEAPVGPTRQGRSIDRLFMIIPVSAAGTVPPLESDDSSKKSDHLIAFAEAQLERKEAYKWVTYSYRYYNKESEKLFNYPVEVA